MIVAYSRHCNVSFRIPIGYVKIQYIVRVLCRVVVVCCVYFARVLTVSLKNVSLSIEKMKVIFV